MTTAAVHASSQLDASDRADLRPLRSLANIRPDEVACIEGILFGMLRDLCYGLHLEEGDCVRCRRTSRTTVILEVADGRRVVLDQDWARFISIGRCDPAKRGRRGRCDGQVRGVA